MMLRPSVHSTCRLLEALAIKIYRQKPPPLSLFLPLSLSLPLSSLPFSPLSPPPLSLPLALLLPLPLSYFPPPLSSSLSALLPPLSHRCSQFIGRRPFLLWSDNVTALSHSFMHTECLPSLIQSNKHPCQAAAQWGTQRALQLWVELMNKLLLLQL